MHEVVVPGEDLLPGLQVTDFRLCSHVAEREKELWSLPLLIRPLIPAWGPTLMASSKPNYLPKAHLQIASHQGLMLQHMNGVGGTFSP